jgi:hypothetical protein
MSIETKIDLVFYWAVAQMFFTILGAIINMYKDKEND